MIKYFISFILLYSTSMHMCADARNLDSLSWSEMAEKYEYSPPKNQENKKDTTQDKSPKTNNKLQPPGVSFNLVNMLLYIGIFVLFVLLIYVLIKADIIKIGGRKVQLNKTFDAENPDILVLTELQKELNNAALENNYNRCLRYEFLLLLEKLQSLRLIRWHKYNTNGEYLNQILDHKFHKRIRHLTVIYEYYWYGEHSLSQEDYEKLAVAFGQLKEEML